jgi:HAD superfamily hydrolase (TIGR01549 family)
MGVESRSGRPALLFDLDGTLVDSVYQHVSAWHEALLAESIELPIWRIHRRIGMSGGLFVRGLARELGHAIDEETRKRLQRAHSQAYISKIDTVRPLPGAPELLHELSRMGIAWAIATSGGRDVAYRSIELLGISPEETPVITRDEVAFAKPNPDLFLAAAARLDVAIESSFVVGDSVWDLLAAQRARALGIGVLSGGYGQSELELAGAYRVYKEPADLLAHLDELGIRQPS